MKASDYLRRGWTTTYYAVNAKGEPVYVNDPAAVKWCIMGAVIRALFEDPRLKDAFAFNNAPGRTQEECIAYLEERGL